MVFGIDMTPEDFEKTYRKWLDKMRSDHPTDLARCANALERIAEALEKEEARLADVRKLKAKQALEVSRAMAEVRM